MGRSAWGEAVGFHRTQRALGQGTGGGGDGARGGRGLARGAGFQAVNDECQIREEMQFVLNVGCSERP